MTTPAQREQTRFVLEQTRLHLGSGVALVVRSNAHPMRVDLYLEKTRSLLGSARLHRWPTQPEPERTRSLATRARLGTQQTCLHRRFTARHSVRSRAHSV